jgi:hypothetical protein
LALNGSSESLNSRSRSVTRVESIDCANRNASVAVAARKTRNFVVKQVAFGHSRQVMHAVAKPVRGTCHEQFKSASEGASGFGSRAEFEVAGTFLGADLDLIDVRQPRRLFLCSAACIRDVGLLQCEPTGLVMAHGGVGTCQATREHDAAERSGPVVGNLYSSPRQGEGRRTPPSVRVLQAHVRQSTASQAGLLSLVADVHRRVEVAPGFRDGPHPAPANRSSG